MNAISPITLPDQDTRRARHLRQCERLAELGMALAERTASHALTEPAPEPDAEPGPSPSALAFTRLARCVRASITLEARLANGTLPPFPTHALPEDQTTDADQEKLRSRLIFLRGCELRQALRQTLENHPDSRRLEEEIESIVDEIEIEDPAAPIGEIYEQGCQIIGIQPNLSRLTPYLQTIFCQKEPAPLSG